MSLEEDMKMFLELPNKIEEFKKAQNLRVITGGKGPPAPPGQNWLGELPLRTVFACRFNDKTIDWEMCFLVHKFSDIYLLKIEMANGDVYERRVDPVLFSNLYRDYRVIAQHPPINIEASEDAIEEAPEGDENDDNRQPNSDAPVGGEDTVPKS